MDQEVNDRVSLITELREAIASEQLFLVYQPQIELASGRIIGVEALARWRHHARGALAADAFIPAAERSGLIIPLGRWVLGEACRQARSWMDQGVAVDHVAVNLSALQCKTPRELEKDIDGVLSEYDLPPQMLELELTETTVMETTRAPKTIRSHGCGGAVSESPPTISAPVTPRWPICGATRSIASNWRASSLPIWRPTRTTWRSPKSFSDWRVCCK